MYVVMALLLKECKNVYYAVKMIKKHYAKRWFEQKLFDDEDTKVAAGIIKGYFVTVMLVPDSESLASAEAKCNYWILVCRVAD